ncbi:MAG: FKBP-type peptidyl-prolyl cis-trans isomerase [Planctomycetes bacterium]|nr:FKBP-type peptidyl-prolyl cis-trans isomerase [Planctomycetota bacterium]MCB9904574.1 FKBP-type peptidyl-prolyl cis-trans isomerase [Planctomycetota bacterium]
MRTLLLLVACLTLPGCALNFTRPIDVEHQVIELASGVFYEDTQTGVGEPAATGDELEVHYQAWLEDGQLVDSSVDRGIPIRFVLGEAPIEGWNEALVGMSAGGKRRLTVPPALAYGEAGVPGLVPPDSPLSFEIELLSIRRSSTDGE